MADCKLLAALHLLDAGFADEAYYLGGYTIELLLKARICENLGIDNFFNEEFSKNFVRYPQAFKSHDIEKLAVVSGLFHDINSQLKDSAFMSDWMRAIEWHEGWRYMSGKSKQETEEFLNSIVNVSSWIKKHL